MDALERAVEEISAEISRLQEQRRVVLTDAERADERLKELRACLVKVRVEPF